MYLLLFSLFKYSFVQTIINSFVPLKLCVCFFQDFPKVLTGGLLGILLCIGIVLTSGWRDKHVCWDFISYYW